jgi:hypothetical protein
MPEEHIRCDQCKTWEATAIDPDAQTWCSRCWATAAERATEAGRLAPFVVDIAFIRLYATTPSDGVIATGPFGLSPLRAVHEVTRRRWAARLGLPEESLL